MSGLENLYNITKYIFNYKFILVIVALVALFSYTFWIQPIYELTKSIFKYRMVITVTTIFLAIAAYYYNKWTKSKIDKKYVPNSEFRDKEYTIKRRHYIIFTQIGVRYVRRLNLSG